MSPRMPRIRGLRATAAVTAAALVLAAQSGTATLATWAEQEWVTAPASGIGTVDCTAPQGAFATRGEGRVLSGSLLDLDSAALAEVTGTLVTNDGARTLVRPASAAPVAGHGDAFADPLRLDVLDDTVAIDATGLLQLPLSTDLGLLGQFGQAGGNGDSAGAAGYLTDSGTVNTDGQLAGYPHFATLRLSDLLDALGYDLGSVVGDSALDVSLDIGAVAGRAALVDACAALWSGDLASALHRDYLAAGLTTSIASPTVSAIGTTVTGTVTGLQNAANALIGDTGLLGGVTAPVVSTVGQVLNTLSFLTGTRVKPNAASSTITAITLNLAPVNALIAAPISDPDGILSISLSQGTVRIDTAALLDRAYAGPHGDRLNGLPPNFNPLTHDGMLDALAQALTAALGTWIGDINGALTTALDGAAVTVQVLVPVQKCSLMVVTCLGTWNDAGAIGITITGTVQGMLNGTVAIAVDLSGLQLGLAGNLLTQLTSTLVTALLQNGLGPIIGAVVDGALRPVSQVPLTVADPLIALVSAVYTNLYLSGTAAITVNVQNDPATGSPEPHDWAAIAGGRYDVAAMRIGLLDAVEASAVRLYLGRGSVGANCSVAQASPLCAGY